MSTEAPQGLPPVKPPSARFIVQLFLIPGLIVAGLVLVFVFGGLSWVGTSSPATFLSKLDSSNPDIRWRAAHELAQVLKRPESLELASNPDFALDIAQRLRKALVELEDAELKAKIKLASTIREIEADTQLNKEAKDQRADQAATVAWHQLRPQRDLVLYLTSCLGDFTIPVGVPILCEMAIQDKGAEIKGLSLRRRRAVWSLANLGENIKRRYQASNAGEDPKVLTSFQKAGIIEKLTKAAQNDTDVERAKMARYTLEVLQNKRPTNVDVWLAEVANSDDIFLREMVAMALNFWDGPLVEPTLLKLAHDTGYGKRIVVTDAD